MRMRFAFLCCLLIGASAQAEDLSDSQRQIIVAVSQKTGVPAGVLYGIWAKESGRLASGWRTGGGDWIRAASIAQPGSQCVREKGWRTCFIHWRALQVICAQRATRGPNRGKPICDPQQVYTSYTLAMGPMQHEPGELVAPYDVPRNGFAWRFTEDGVDFDGDRVVDPHNFGDAVAMTATQLRRYHAEHPDPQWQWASNRA